MFNLAVCLVEPYYVGINPNRLKDLTLIWCFALTNSWVINEKSTNGCSGLSLTHSHLLRRTTYFYCWFSWGKMAMTDEPTLCRTHALSSRVIKALIKNKYCFQPRGRYWVMFQVDFDNIFVGSSQSICGLLWNRMFDKAFEIRSAAL